MHRFTPWATVLIGCLFCSDVLGQKSDDPVLARKLEAVSYAGSEGYDAVLFDKRYQGVKGSPYAFAGWRAGELRLQGGSRVPNVLLRYDSFRNVLLGRRSATSPDSLVVKKDNVTSFVLLNPLTGTLQRFERVGLAPNVGPGYFMEMLHDGTNYTLLKHYGKEFVPANYKGAFAATATYDELVDKTRYYLRRPNGDIVPVKLTAKSLKEGMPDMATVLDSEIARTKRTLRSEDDVTAVLDAIDPVKNP